MKKFLSVVGMMLFVSQVYATVYPTVYVDVTSYVHGTVTGRKVSLIPVIPFPTTSGIQLVAGDAIVKVTDTNGIVNYSNVVSGCYNITIQGSPAATFPIVIDPLDVGYINAATKIGVCDLTSLLTGYYNKAQIDALLGQICFSCSLVGTNGGTNYLFDPTFFTTTTNFVSIGNQVFVPYPTNGAIEGYSLIWTGPRTKSVPPGGLFPNALTNNQTGNVFFRSVTDNGYIEDISGRALYIHQGSNQVAPFGLLIDDKDGLMLSSLDTNGLLIYNHGFLSAAMYNNGVVTGATFMGNNFYGGNYAGDGRNLTNLPRGISYGEPVANILDFGGTPYNPTFNDAGTTYVTNGEYSDCSAAYSNAVAACLASGGATNTIFFPYGVWPTGWRLFVPPKLKIKGVGVLHTADKGGVYGATGYTNNPFSVIWFYNTTNGGFIRNNNDYGYSPDDKDFEICGSTNPLAFAQGGVTSFENAPLADLNDGPGMSLTLSEELGGGGHHMENVTISGFKLGLLTWLNSCVYDTVNWVGCDAGVSMTGNGVLGQKGDQTTFLNCSIGQRQNGRGYTAGYSGQSGARGLVLINDNSYRIGEWMCLTDCVVSVTGGNVELVTSTNECYVKLFGSRPNWTWTGGRISATNRNAAVVSYQELGFSPGATISAKGCWIDTPAYTNNVPAYGAVLANNNLPLFVETGYFQESVVNIEGFNARQRYTTTFEGQGNDVGNWPIGDRKGVASGYQSPTFTGSAFPNRNLAPQTAYWLRFQQGVKNLGNGDWNNNDYIDVVINGYEVIGTMSSNSVVLAVTDTNGIFIGQPITGNGLQSFTTISNLIGSDIHLSKVATNNYTNIVLNVHGFTRHGVVLFDQDNTGNAPPTKNLNGVNVFSSYSGYFNIAEVTNGLFALRGSGAGMFTQDRSLPNNGWTVYGVNESFRLYDNSANADIFSVSNSGSQVFLGYGNMALANVGGFGSVWDGYFRNAFITNLVFGDGTTMTTAATGGSVSTNLPNLTVTNDTTFLANAKANRYNFNGTNYYMATNELGVTLGGRNTGGSFQLQFSTNLSNPNAQEGPSLNWFATHSGSPEFAIKSPGFLGIVSGDFVGYRGHWQLGGAIWNNETIDFEDERATSDPQLMLGASKLVTFQSSYWNGANTLFVGGYLSQDNPSRWGFSYRQVPMNTNNGEPKFVFYSQTPTITNNLNSRWDGTNAQWFPGVELLVLRTNAVAVNGRLYVTNEFTMPAVTASQYASWDSAKNLTNTLDGSAWINLTGANVSGNVPNADFADTANSADNADEANHAETADDAVRAQAVTQSPLTNAVTNIVASSLPKRTILSVSLDGNGSTVPTGKYGYYPVAGGDYTITGWSITAAGASPTCTIDVWKTNAGTILPAVANTIMGTKPALATGNAIYSTTLTSWSTGVTNGDIWEINVDASSNATNITFQVFGRPR